MTVAVLRGDARHLPLPDASVDLIVTSPPYYGLRSYTDGGIHYAGQIGSEATPAEWVAALVECTAEWMRVLKPEGSMFVNLGDKYSGAQQQTHGNQSTETSAAYWRRTDPKVTGIRAKSLLGLPWRYALACTDQLGLILRAEIIWAKPNGLPESVTDRVRRAHEQIFHLVKQPRYYSAVDEIREPHTGNTHGRRSDGQMSPKESATVDAGHRRGFFPENRENPLGKLPGSVWQIPSQPLTVPPELGVDHFAAFPMELPRRIINGWSPPGICTQCGQGRRPLAETWLGVKERETPPYGAGNHGIGKSTLGSRGSGARILGHSCACGIWYDHRQTRPAIVLDPFGGTGTTALLAHTLGRHGITIDHSNDYARLAQWRTHDPAELARALQVDKPPTQINGQEALFA